jgi:glycosyltransferase involved in cell wall biosynthesis
MKLIFANLSKGWGGGEKWFFTVGKALMARGHEVAWIVYPGSALAQRLRQENLPHYAAPLRTWQLLNPLQMGKLKNWLRRFEADAVLLNASHELKVVGWAAARVGVPKVVLRRGVSYPLSDHAFNRWLIHKVVTHFLANAEATFQAFAARFPFIRSLPHATVYNGIDVASWTRTQPQPKAGHLIMSARLAREKGIDRALQALALLKQRAVSARLSILGEGPDEERLRQLTKELELEDRVQFLGFVEDVPEVLRKGWAFVFTPTHGEGTSLALIEAMALGMPCLAFDTPAMKEVILNGETGYLLPDGDITGLADRLQQLLADSELRHRLGAQAKARAESHFDLSRVAEEVEALLLQGARDE